jgi:DNA-directed RNA polymerase beta subunit
MIEASSARFAWLLVVCLVLLTRQMRCLQMGVSLLQHCFFVHVESDEEKFRVLMEMLHKLYALVNLQCCEDNPDALTHHEVLLPGQLLIKFFKEKCEDVLTAFSEQVHSAGGCNVCQVLFLS